MPFIRIIPNLLEVSINGTWSNQRQVTNVFHLFSPEDWGPGGMADPAVFAERMCGQWQDHILPLVANNYTVTGTSFLSLSSATGPAGTTGPDPGFPTVGSQTGTALPPNVSGLVRKNTVSLRNQRPGRTYVVGFIETDMGEDGELTGAKITATNLAFESFRTGSESGVPPEVRLHVPHIQIPGGPPPPTPVLIFGTSSPLIDFTTDNIAATQRRRLRG